MDFGKSLKIALLQRGMKQKDLADQMQVSRPYISAIANNKKHFTKANLISIPKHLGYKVSEFIALGED